MSEAEGTAGGSGTPEPPWVETVKQVAIAAFGSLLVYVIFWLARNASAAPRTFLLTVGGGALGYLFARFRFSRPVRLLIAALLIAVAAAIAPLASPRKAHHVANSRVTTTATTAFRPVVTTSPTTKRSTTTASTATGPVVVIVAPKNGASVSAKVGAALRGTVSGLSDVQTLWLLDFDGTTYTADQQVAVQGERWTATTGSLGNTTPPPAFTSTEVIVVATASCQATLALLSNAADNSTAVLPSGCARQASVVINVDRP